MVRRKKEKCCSAFSTIAAMDQVSCCWSMAIPGSGKTSLVYELQKPVADRKGFFVSGKFEQLQQDTPYSAFILAFRELINYLLTKG